MQAERAAADEENGGLAYMHAEAAASSASW